MYTTLARVKAELKGTEANAGDAVDQLLMGYIRTVTQRIRAFKWEFEPLYYTRKLTANRSNVNRALGTLTLGDNLLEPTSIITDGTTLTYGTDVLNYPNDGEYPIRVLRLASLTSGPCSTWYPIHSTTSLIETISITGFWGMREYYNTEGFINSGDTVPTGGITASATSFTVTDADGDNALDYSPRFSPGNLIRIDNELMDVLAVNTTTNTLTVRRGARQTTAASHTEGTAIQTWEVEPDILNCATRQVGLLYARRGAYQQVTTYPDGLNVTYPSDLLADIRGTLARFNYV